MIEDAELFRRYAVDRSEAAFAELVERHLGLVYSVALRQVQGDVHLARDVAQKVFSDLARKAPTLARHPVLSGWLYRCTQFTAIDVMRSERRRRVREQEAQTMHALNASAAVTADAEQLRPILDQVMGELNDHDRDAVMLRFFEGRPFAEIGTKLCLSEDAARMRVERALEKMRRRLVGRGLTSTTAALATILAGQAGMAAPLGLAASITGSALAGAGTTAAFAAVTGMAKLQLALAGVFLIAGGTGLIMQQRVNAALARELAVFGVPSGSEATRLREQNRRLAEAVAEVRSYQGDPAELNRLRSEAEALQQRSQDRAAKLAADRSTPLTYEAAEIDTVPEVMLQPKPAYPFDMRREGLGGTVVVDFVVDERGGVRDITILNSTRPEFEAAVLDSVARWKFRPGRKDGNPVGTRMKVPIVFSLEEVEEKP